LEQYATSCGIRTAAEVRCSVSRDPVHVKDQFEFTHEVADALGRLVLSLVVGLHVR
jgi:hypothetical protein